VTWDNTKTKKDRLLANYAIQELIHSLENNNVIIVQQVIFAQIPLQLHSSVKLELIQAQDQFHAHLAMTALSVNLKSKFQILSINSAQQVSIASMILQTILNLNRDHAPLASINL
jgi:hypothetical protein